MKTKTLLATIILSATLFTGCSLKQDNTAIIKVNDKNITQAQFDESFERVASSPMIAQLGLDLKNDKNGFLYLMLKDRVINELIVKTLIEEEIESRNIKVNKDDINNELKDIIDKIGSKEKFNEILKQNGISPAQFKKDLAEEVKMKKLVESLEDTNVGEAEAKKFYNDNQAKFKYPEKVRASHILVAANPEEIKERIKSTVKEGEELSDKELQTKVDNELSAKYEKAEKLLSEVKKDPTMFAKYARENSDDITSAKQGGDLGFFAHQEMVEPFSKAAFEMKPNTISAIVKTQYGYHIIMVTDRKAAGLEPFEKVKEEIITYLKSQKQVKVLENFIEGLKKNAKIEYINQEYSPTSIEEAIKKQAETESKAKSNEDDKAIKGLPENKDSK